MDASRFREDVYVTGLDILHFPELVMSETSTASRSEAALALANSMEEMSVSPLGNRLPSFARARFVLDNVLRAMTKLTVVLVIQHPAQDDRFTTESLICALRVGVGK